jgi:ubiquitin-like 1-activating enzyme E1 B
MEERQGNYLTQYNARRYRGTVISYQKGITKCYECDTKLTAKSYAICTIRTNPSTPIHCIVWAKLLFERLFGKIDESNSISDFEVLFNEAHKTGEEFAAKVFDKVYVQDIIKLTDLTQQESNGEAPNKQIWNSGKAPEPIDRTNATSEAVDTAQLEEQRVWNLSENIQHFIKKYVK